MWSGPAYLWFCPLIPSHSLCSQLHWPSFRFLNSWTLISYSDVREKNQLWWGTCAVLCSVAQSCLTPGGPLDCSLPSPSVYGILQASILEWVAISFSRGSSQPRDQYCISYISCIGFFTSSITWEVKVTALNCSDLPPGFLNHLLAPGSRCSNLFFAQMLKLSSKS